MTTVNGSPSPYVSARARLSFQMSEVAAILASSSRSEELLFERYLLLDGEERPVFVMALIGELMVARARKSRL